MKLVNFNKRVLFILYLILAFSSQLISQNTYLEVPDTLEGYVKASFIKDVYEGNMPLNGIIDKQKSGGFYWRVYSDRVENTLYDHNGREKNDKLDFMEMVVVKDVKYADRKYWLNVYSLIQIIDDKQAKKNVNRGWIPIDKVLLTTYALLNDSSITKKAMVLNSIEFNNREVQSQTEYLCYNSPKATNSDKAVRKFRIFYILKEEDSWVLLSKTDKLKGSNVKGNVLGWMPRRQLTFWDHRICYEPASDEEAKEVYKDKSLYVFSDLNGLDDFVNNEVVRENSYYKVYKIEQNRLNPNIMRMPILINYTKNKKQVVTVNSLENIDEETKANIHKKLQLLYDRREIVNILFVIDGTKSMAPYIDPIRKSIKEIIDSKDLLQSGTNLRFGLVVYRDYQDKPLDYKIIQLRDDDKIEEIITKLLTFEAKSSMDDKNLPEAQYQGLVKGINEAGFDYRNCNVVVLVGDAGNHYNDQKFNRMEVINAMKKYNVNLIAFQVINGSHDTYDDFYFDVRDYYLLKCAKMYLEDKNDVSLSRTQMENTIKLDYPKYTNEQKSLSMFGRYTYASGSKPMPPDLLRENIVISIQNYLKIVDVSITTLRGLEEGSHTIVDDVMELFLRNSGWNNNEIEALKKLGDFTARGYLSKRYYNEKTDCFVPVVFLSINEKQQINKILSKLTRGEYPPSERKEVLQEALIEQCLKMLGDASKENIMEKTIDDIWKIILSIPFNGDPNISQKPLFKISEMKDGDFDTFYKKFEKSANDFIETDFESSKFTLSGQTFYWIPLSNFPGNE